MPNLHFIIQIVLLLGIVLNTFLWIKPEAEKTTGKISNVQVYNRALDPDIIKKLSVSDSSSITFEALESIVNMEKDDYIYSYSTIGGQDITIIFSPDGAMRIVKSFVEDDEIRSIIKGHKTEHYP